MKGYGSVLSNRRYVALWLGQSVSNFGDALTRIALVILVSERTSSPLALSAIIAVQMAPMLFLGPFAGSFVDRLNPKKVMLAADLVRAALIAGIIAAPSLTVVYALAFLSATASLFFMPARSATIPELVGKENILTATALSQVTYQTIMLIGPAAGGAIVGFVGTWAAFAIDAASFVVSASVTFLVRFPKIPRSTRPATAGGVWDDLVEGVRFLWDTRVLQFAILTLGGTVVGFGFFSIIYMHLLRNELGIAPTQFGLLESAGAAGAALMTVIIGQFGQKWARGRLILNGVAALGAIAVVLGWNWGWSVLLVAAVASGVAEATVNVPLAALFMERTPARMRGRVFAATNSLLNVSGIIGWVGAGPLVDAIGTRWALTLVGAYVLIIALVPRRLAGYRELNLSGEALGVEPGGTGEAVERSEKVGVSATPS